MSMLQRAFAGGFDATTVDPRGEYTPVPAGIYDAAIVATEEKRTKAGDGSYLKLTLQILSGPFKGRTLYDMLNLDNPKPDTVKIAQQTVSAICHAVNKLHVTREEEWIGIPIQIKTSIRKNEEYGDREKIDRYMRRAGQTQLESPEIVPAAVAADADDENPFQ